MKLESLLHSVVLRLFAWCPPRRPAFLSSLWSSVPWSAWYLLQSEKPEHKGTQWGGEKGTLSCTIRDIQKVLPRQLSVCLSSTQRMRGSNPKANRDRKGLTMKENKVINPSCVIFPESAPQPSPCSHIHLNLHPSSKFHWQAWAHHSDRLFGDDE